MYNAPRAVFFTQKTLTINLGIFPKFIFGVYNIQVVDYLHRHTFIHICENTHTHTLLPKYSFHAWVRETYQIAQVTYKKYTRSHRSQVTKQ